jgi:hypothetical protein
MAQQQHVLKCPVDGIIVPIVDETVEGSVVEGGHGTIGGKSRATCPKCERNFNAVEIDTLEFWQ